MNRAYPLEFQLAFHPFYDLFIKLQFLSRGRQIFPNTDWL
jgi:hypothetical protein